MIVVCATSGVQVGTEQCWKLAEEAGLPRIIFVNKMDRENADFDSILDNLRGKFGKHVLPLQLPLGKEDNFQGIIDLYKMKAYRANGNGSDEIEIPDEYKEAAAAAHEKMVEAAVEADDDCMMRYLEGEEISDEEIMKCLIKGIRQAIIYPMLCGSAYKNIGLGRLMNAIIDFTYPAILNDYIVMDKETGEEEVRDANAPMAALVFKTTSDPFVGRLSYFRVFSGSIKADSVVYNSRREEEERIANIFTMRGKTQIPMKQVPAGDIGTGAREIGYMFGQYKRIRNVYEGVLQVRVSTGAVHSQEQRLQVMDFFILQRLCLRITARTSRALLFAYQVQVMLLSTQQKRLQNLVLR